MSISLLHNLPDPSRTFLCITHFFTSHIIKWKNEPVAADVRNKRSAQRLPHLRPICVGLLHGPGILSLAVDGTDKACGAVGFLSSLVSFPGSLSGGSRRAGFGLQSAFRFIGIVSGGLTLAQEDFDALRTRPSEDEGEPAPPSFFFISCAFLGSVALIFSKSYFYISGIRMCFTFTSINKFV